MIARYLPDGSLDRSFSGDGRVMVGISAHGATVDSHNRIIVAGSVCDDSIPRCYFALERYRPNGELDDSFSGDGMVKTNIGGYGQAFSPAIDPQGRIVAAGAKGRFLGYTAIARYTPNGSLDRSFSDDGKYVSDFMRAWPPGGLAIDASGRVLVSGYAGGRSDADAALARLTTSGNLDRSFSGDGKVVSPFESRFTSLAIDGYGKIVAAGENFKAARYLPDGGLDPAFGNDGKVATGFPYGAVATAVGIDSRGRVVGAGYQYTSPALEMDQFAVARLVPNGSLDRSFSGDGRVRTNFAENLSGNEIYGMAIDAQDRIVATGHAGGRDGNLYQALTRYIGYP